LLTAMTTSDPIWLCAQFEDGAEGPSIGSDEDGPYNLRSYWTGNLTSWNLFGEDLFMRVVHKQTIVGVAEGTNSATVLGTRLFQNVPNPFSGTTLIRYSIPASARVGLRVHDVAGKLVRTLESGHSSSGTHSVVWDGKNEMGAHVSAGVYFCNLDVEGRKSVVKMALLR